MNTPKTVLGFELGEVLGAGGFGFVKEAKLKDKMYAMKILTKGSAGWNATEAEMVKTEISIMEALDHPHIIKVISYDMNGSYPREDGTTEDCVIIVMEVAQGGNLFDILFFTEGFSEDVSRTYLGQLVDAIGAMHRAGIAHRDIKPQNTLLDNNFNIKICDFGLSKKTNSVQLMQTKLGTLPFQAPEMLMGREYDFGVDIFALGVLFFLMLTGGVPPFRCAKVDDKWFKCIAGGAQKRFWKKHNRAKKKVLETCGEEGFQHAADLFFKMVAYQPTERLDITATSEHAWLSGNKKTGAALKDVMKEVVNEAMEKKRCDPELGGQASQAMRSLKDIIGDLSLEIDAPQDPSRFVPNFTYEILPFSLEDEEDPIPDHPYVLMKMIQAYLKSMGIDKDHIKFDPEHFTMNVEAEFTDNKKANIIILAYREDGKNYIAFKKANAFAYQTQANMLINKIMTEHCEQLGDVKQQELTYTKATSEVINEVKAHMLAMKGGEN